ncbi:MAG TPA: hypothetical protein VJN96_23640 [Vicinamibacterales bacterium]|nr:hypothetical protein [Vicinamibacterales bacterium]
MRAILVAGAVAAALQWTPQTSGVMSSLRGVSAVNDRVAWASGSGATVLRTADGGATWSKLAVTTDRVDFRDIDAIDERTAYVLSIGNGATSRIYKTTDAGEHWDLQLANQDPKVFLDAMSFWDATHGIAVSDTSDGHFVIFTTDDGKTWTRLPDDRLPPAQPNEGFFAASGTNIAVFGQNDVWIGTGAAEKARVLRSSDHGRTWKVAETPLLSGQKSGIYSIAFRDPQHGVIVGGTYDKESEALDNCAVTSDGGATWTLIKEHGLSGFRSVVAYLPGPPGALLAVGPSGSDVSADDGRTWTPLAGPGFHTFSLAPKGRTGWGAGSQGRIAKLDGLTTAGTALRFPY